MRITPFVLACLLLGSCKTDDIVRPAAGTAASVVSGANQTGTAGATLPTPVTIRVSGAEGRPVSGVTVTWQPAEGSGSVSPQSATTNGEGLVSTTWTLGTAAGDQQLAVQAGGQAPLVVHAIASAGKAASVQVESSADSMTAVGDTMWLRATARDAYGNVTAGKPVWTSSAPAIVLIDSLGAARAFGKGTATVRALIDGVVGERAIRVTGTAVIGAAGTSGGSVSNPDGASLTVSPGDPVDLRVSKLGNPWTDRALERPAFGFAVKPQASAAASYGMFSASPSISRPSGPRFDVSGQTREVTFEFAIGHTVDNVDGMFVQFEVDESVTSPSAVGSLRRFSSSVQGQKFTYYFPELTLNSRKDGVVVKLVLKTGESLAITAVLRSSNLGACADQYRLVTPERSPDGDAPGVPVVYIHGFQPEPGFQTCEDWKRNFDIRKYGGQVFDHMTQAGLGSTAQYWIYTYPTFGTTNVAAERLADLLRARFPGRKDIVLIGHSTGGLVGRAAMHLYGADPQVQRLITLGSPHLGTGIADFAGISPLLDTPGLRDLAPSSLFIRDLNSGTENRLKYYSFAGETTPVLLAGCGNGSYYCAVLLALSAYYTDHGVANDGLITMGSALLRGSHLEIAYGNGYDHGELGKGKWEGTGYRFPDPLLSRVAELVAEVVAPPAICTAALAAETYADDSQVTGGQSFTKTWTLRNTGSNCVWDSRTKLQYVSGQLSTSQSAVPVSGTVQPNGTFVFTVPMKAPGSAGTYREEWKLVDASGNTIRVGNSNTVWAQIVVPQTGGPSICTSAATASLVTESYPDNTQVSAGQAFTKSWTLRNADNNCVWDSHIRLLYVINSAGQLSTSQAAVAVSGTVQPNGTYVFSVPMKAPGSAGTYREDWKLVDAAGNTIRVGNSNTVWAQIVVPQRGPSLCTSASGAGFVGETYTDNTEVPAGQSFTKTWTLRNTGSNCIWDASIRLVYVSNTAGQLSTSQAAVSVSGTVQPNGTFVFSVPMKAPGSAGTYREDWKLVDASGNTIRVGSSSTVWAQIVVPQSGPSLCTSASGAGFVGETYTDNTQVPAGQSFTKTWTLRNIGSNCIWDSRIRLVYVSNTAGQLSTSQAAVAVSGTVQPNGTFVFSVPMKAPAGAGTYREDWKLVDANGNTIRVGNSNTVWAQIVVPQTGATLCTAASGAGFVGESYTDNTQVPAGQSFTKTWTLRNIGTSCVWDSRIKLVYVSNSAGLLSTSQAAVPVSGTVQPNGTFVFSVPMRAPAARGTYREDWKLIDANGTTVRVGNSNTVWAQIAVP